MVCLTQDSMEIRESRNVRSDFDSRTCKVQRGVYNNLLFDIVLVFDGRDFRKRPWIAAFGAYHVNGDSIAGLGAKLQIASMTRA